MQGTLRAPSDPHPRVTVLMSVHNGARYLGKAVRSILDQTFSDFEFIIIDDGSKDESWKILVDAAAQDRRILLLQNHSNLGLPQSLNKGIKAAKGSYLARIDADDIAYPERLAKQVAMFESIPELVLAGSAYKVLDETGEVVRIDRHPLDDTSIRWQMLFHNSFCHSSIMMRTSVLAEHGVTYNENCRYAQDYELWSRLLEYGPAANCAEPLVGYRLHPDNRNPEAYREQQSIATRVAVSNVQKIGLEISEAEMAKLRSFDANHSGGAAATEKYFTLLISIFSHFYKNRSGLEKLYDIQWRILMDVLTLNGTGVGIKRILSFTFALITLNSDNLFRYLCYVFLEKLRIRTGRENAQ